VNVAIHVRGLAAISCFILDLHSLARAFRQGSHFLHGDSTLIKRTSPSLTACTAANPIGGLEAMTASKGFKQPILTSQLTLVCETGEPAAIARDTKEQNLVQSTYVVAMTWCHLCILYIKYPAAPENMHL